MDERDALLGRMERLRKRLDELEAGPRKCVDCGVAVARRGGRGRHPKRCPPCAAAAKRRQDMAAGERFRQRRRRGQGGVRAPKEEA